MPRRILIAVAAAVACAASLLFPVAAKAAGCPAAACVIVVGTQPVRPVTHFASGVTDSVVKGIKSDESSLSQLGVRMYRSAPGVGPGGSLSWNNWATASKGAATTLILSDLWAAEHGPGYPPTPWSNWAAYDSWVATTVAQVLASGQKVTYWEPYSEPGWHTYYKPADFKSETTGDLLQQFLTTYQIIKALDPGASVVGPSAGLFLTSPLPASANNRTPDVNTFLNFCVQNNIQLGAFAIHENGFGPAQIAKMVAYVKAAIAHRRALGHPPVYVDEYAAAPTEPIPGWQVGYISALEYSGATLAAESCWNNCFVGDLDSSLINAGRDKSADWFVNRTYALMAGQMVPVATNSSTVVGVASSQRAARTVMALIGRDQGCAVTSWCRKYWNGQRPAAPERIQVTVDVPWTGAVHVHLSDETFQPNTAVAAARAAAVSGVSVRRLSKSAEAVTFVIPAFVDGSAYNLVVTA